MKAVEVSSDLPRDPDNPGNVLGWGVVRNSPWSLLGVYSSREKAQAELSLSGEGHEVRYGSHAVGTDDFVSGIDPLN